MKDKSHSKALSHPIFDHRKVGTQLTLFMWAANKEHTALPAEVIGAPPSELNSTPSWVLRQRILGEPPGEEHLHPGKT